MRPRVASPPEAWIETSTRPSGGAASLVASPPEAWIETLSSMSGTELRNVASPPEAWIETYAVTPKDWISRSPPPRRRGLKLVRAHARARGALVASPPEAWIETFLGEAL